MKTLIDINKDLLDDYSLWENANKDNWSIAAYINQFYDINTALAFTKFFFPDFIEKEGCVILSFRYDEKVFKQWHEEFKGDISHVEKYCNLYDVADFFHINSSKSVSDEVVEELAKALKKSWEINCKLLFPNRDMMVDVFKEYEVTRITLYSRGT